MDQSSLNDLSQAQRERLAHIEFRVWFLGQVSRIDLIKTFDIAPAVGTRDFAAYKKIAEGNLAFDDSRKVYVPSSGFSPVFSHEPERVLSALSKGFGDGVARNLTGYVPSATLQRLGEPSLPVLAALTQAIYQRKVVRLTYHSYSSGATRRDLIPFAIADSGGRWHVRAFDRKRNEFRDFAINRVDKPLLLEDEAIQPHEMPDQDFQWSRVVSLELIPHPCHDRPDVVMRDLGMRDGKLVLNVRAPLVGYALQNWCVDCSADASLDPRRFRLSLKDADKVLFAVQSAVLAPGFHPQ